MKTPRILLAVQAAPAEQATAESGATDAAKATYVAAPDKAKTKGA